VDSHLPLESGVTSCEPSRSSYPNRSFSRREAILKTDAKASLLGRSPEEQRNPVVCRHPRFGQWIALLSFSAPSLKCSPRDQWTGWDFRHQYDRLKLLTNNNHFLIPPDWHVPNLGSRILYLCQPRLPLDWQKTFGHPLVLLETFVDPQRFHGTIYKAANWIYIGQSKGFHRTRQGYRAMAASRKMVFVKPLISNVQALLSRPVLEPTYRIGSPKFMMSAQHMTSLPDFFEDIPDPRRPRGGVTTCLRC